MQSTSSLIYTDAEAFPPVDLQRLPFDLYPLVRLSGPNCTLAQAEHMMVTGRIKQRQFARYQAIWRNSTFRFVSSSQDWLFAKGGWDALERRFKRAQNLHRAWYRKVIGNYGA